MKKIEFGQAIAVFANIGVLVGILLLAYELNQNRQMMQTTSPVHRCSQLSAESFSKCPSEQLAGIFP